MPKNIILLSDGTGNSNVKGRGTNVFKLYEAIDFNLRDYPQVAFYDDGVGTQEFKPLKLLSGAFGWGLSRNVRQLYKELVHSYEVGDKVYLFGFSRGAFTVRSLAGLIASEGILDIRHYPTSELLDKAVLQLYEGYRAKETALLESVLYAPFMKIFFDAYAKEKLQVLGEQSKKIEFIGVWDTVDAVGLPVDELTELWNKLIFRFKFPDHRLNPNVKKTCHALSIDDERQSFSPLLWNDDPRIEQVWFPGVHSNVGGGYPQQGLSLVALEWMMKKAEIAGLKFVQDDLRFVHNKEYAFDKLYDSRAGVAVYYRYQPRNIAEICSLNRVAVPLIHESAFQRIAQGVLGYGPGNLPTTFDVVNDEGRHKNSASISRLVGDGVSELTPKAPTLLAHVDNYRRARRGMYYVFVFYSLFTLYWLVKDDLADPRIGVFGTLKILVSPDGLLEKLAILFTTHFGFVVVGLILFSGTVYLRKKMEGIFSNFWAKLRHRVEAL